MADFMNILSKPADAIEKPKPTPAGTYTCVCVGLFELKDLKTKNGVAKKLHFKLKPLAAGPDVDQQQLIEAGGLGGYFPEFQVYLGVTEDDADKNMHRAKEFAENCGVATSGLSVRAMLEAVQNQQVQVQIGHRPSDDGSMMYAEVKRTFKI